MLCNMLNDLAEAIRRWTEKKGLEKGFKGASRGLEGGLKGA